MEQAQVFVSLDAAKLDFESEQRGGTPALLLIARAPTGDAATARLDARVDGLDQVRRLEARAQLREDAELMERERFVEALLERIWVPRRASRAAHLRWAPPNHAAGVNAGSVRSRCQRARSNGSPVCMMCSSIGTMRRAIAQSALVLSPPFRALSASYAGR